MLEEVVTQAGYGRYIITVKATIFSKDISIVLYGGELPHIGACAFSYKKDQGIEVQVIKAPFHKEDKLAEDIAKRVSGEFSCNVCVAAGIHIENATKKEIQILFQHTEKAIDKFIDEAKKRRRADGF